MKNDKMDSGRIKELLQRLPEREPPAGLTGKIMKQISYENQSIMYRCYKLFTSFFTITVQPARVALVGAGLAAAFYLGTLTGTSSFSPDLKETETESFSGEASYYIGRGLLVAGHRKEALVYLNRAVLLNPDEPEYGLWRAVAWQSAGNPVLERQQYQRLVSRHPDYLPALVNLGHNQLETGDLDGALTSYNRVLRMMPQERRAMYNIGLVYRLKGDLEKERSAWKRYLAKYRTGKNSYRAVRHLNELGDYHYRTAQLGYRRIIINQDALLGNDTKAMEREVFRLAEQFNRVPVDVLDLVVFHAENGAMAMKKAKMLKKQLARHLKGTKRVRISWFGQPEFVRTDEIETVLKHGILVFSQPEKITESKERRI